MKLKLLFQYCKVAVKERELPGLNGWCKSLLSIGLFAVETEWFEPDPSILNRVTPT